MQTKSTSGKVALVLAMLCAGAMVSESAFAHGRYRGGPRVSFGIGIGFGAPMAYSYYRPYYQPYYYAPYYPPAYYPPVVVAPPAPPVYVEQQPYVVPPPTRLNQPEPQSYQPQTYQPQTYQPSDAPQSASQPNVWYYCNESKTYYPYVKQCPAGWQQVTPQPQG